MSEGSACAAHGQVPGGEWWAGLNRQAEEATRAREQSGVSEARGRAADVVVGSVSRGACGLSGLPREGVGGCRAPPHPFG